MFTTTNVRRSKLFAGLTGVAALALLTACAADEPAAEAPADQEVEQQTAEAQPEATEDAGTSAAEDTAPATEDTAAAPANDEVFAIIDAVEAEYDGGFIVDIDADDDNSVKYDVDVVVGNELFELDVTADGSITVDDKESDDDKVAKANSATVTVTEALTDAFAQHPDATFDQIELDEDDGTLKWEVDLDDADGSDIELEIPAK